MEQYCRNCGALLNDRYPVCIMCRKSKGVGDKFCAFCGEELPEPGAKKPRRKTAGQDPLL